MDGRRSHWVPRSREGRLALALFVALFLLAMPPVSHVVIDRVDPTLIGVPFVFTALLGIYCALIGVLVWAYRRGL